MTLRRLHIINPKNAGQNLDSMTGLSISYGPFHSERKKNTGTKETYLAVWIFKLGQSSGLLVPYILKDILGKIK